MSVKRPQPTETHPSVTIRFILQDPESLTGKSEKEILIQARRGDSILGAALDAGIQIEHSCGGVCACSTCHVYIKDGDESINEPQDDEMDRVEEAPGLQRNSRLSCQSRVVGSGPITVEVPAWNRNAVKEKPHDD